MYLVLVLNWQRYDLFTKVSLLHLEVPCYKNVSYWLCKNCSCVSKSRKVSKISSGIAALICKLSIIRIFIYFSRKDILKKMSFSKCTPTRKLTCAKYFFFRCRNWSLTKFLVNINRLKKKRNRVNRKKLSRRNIVIFPFSSP